MWDLTLYLALVAACISWLGAVFSMWFARKNNVRELQNDVDEIASVVEKVHRESKRQQMRRVREAAGDSEPSGPPNLEPRQDALPLKDKSALRRMVFGGKPQ